MSDVDPFGVEQAQTAMNIALSLADCAAGPAPFFIDMAIAPLVGRNPNSPPVSAGSSGGPPMPAQRGKPCRI